jgi:putative hydrolases of HD superfamily
MDLEKFLSFSRLLNSFAHIERRIPMPGTERLENDMEHSYHLALMAWYLIDSQKLDLDIGLTIKYALAHDLVEIYAGDTWVWSKDTEEHASKRERETEAAKRLQENFSEFPDLHAIISEYEKHESREAKFVYALDKTVACILIREEGGSHWRTHHVTLDMIAEKKSPQVALSPEVEPYFNELIELIRKENITAENP